MSVLNKIEKWFTLYKGDDSVILFVFEDENGNDIDLSSDYSEITFTMYDQSKTQELQYTIGSGLSIQNTNELKIILDDTTTGALDADQKYAYDIQFTLSSGDKETYIKGKFYVEDTFEGSSNDINSKLVKIDGSGEQVVIELGSLGQKFSDYVGKSQDWAEGTDAEVTALGGEHSSKGWASESETFREQAAKSAVSAQQEANNASYPANANLYDDEADFLASTSDGQFGIFEGSVWKNNSGVAQHQFDFITRVNSIQELVNVEGKGPNSRALVSGFYTQGDGGGGTFYWDASEDKANHNGGTIINPDHNSTIGSANWYSSTGDSTDDSGDGCWKRSEKDFISVLKFGAKGDNSNDDYDAIYNAIDYAIKNGIGKVKVPRGTYYTSKEILKIFSTSEAQHLEIVGDDATLIRDYSDLTTGDGILKIQGVPQGTETVSSDISKGDRTINVASTASMEKGMYFYLRTDEVYSTRSGGPSDYDKGYMGYITKIIDATTIEVNVNFPYSFSSASTLELLFYKKSNITVRGLNFEWKGSFASATDTAKGLSILRLSNVTLDKINASGTDNNDIYLELCYDLSATQLNTQGVQDTDNQLSYGLVVSGCWDSTVSRSNLVSARHGVAITGVPSAGLVFDKCVFDSLGESSGVGFDTHIAEDVKVVNSRILRGINVSGGHFIFDNCYISNGKGGRQAVVQRRDASFQKSVTLRGCTLDILTPSSSTPYLYNLAPSTYLKEYGDFTLEECTIESEVAFNIIGSLNGDDDYTSVGLFALRNNTFGDAINTIVSTSGYTSPSGDKGRLVMTGNSFKDVDTVGGNNIFDYLEITGNRPLDSGAGDTCRFIAFSYDTVVSLNNIIYGECRIRSNGTVVFKGNVTIYSTENTTFVHNFEGNTLLYLQSNIIIDSDASYAFLISGSTTVVASENRFKNQTQDKLLYGPSTPSVQGALPTYNYDNNSVIKDNHALAQRDLIKTGSGSPVGSLTPNFVGQRYQDTSTSSPRKIYEAIGTTDSDWEVLN